MADTVASCSNPCMTATLSLLASTLIQSMKTSKQPETRVGSKLPSVIIVARCFKVDSWTALSKDVRSIHEMHCESNMMVCWSKPCVLEVPINQRHTALPKVTNNRWYTVMYTILPKAANNRHIPFKRMQGSITSPMGNAMSIITREWMILPIEYQGSSNDDHHHAVISQKKESSMKEDNWEETEARSLWMRERAERRMGRVMWWKIWWKTRPPGV